MIGHARYLLEAIGPELRQYIVAGNDEERPFSRDQRRWIYASAKQENNYFGFGTDNDIEYTPATRSSSTAPSAGRSRRPAAAGQEVACPAPRCSAGRAAAGTRSGRTRSSTSRR